MNIVFFPKYLKENLKNLNPSEKGEYCIFAELIQINFEKNWNSFENREYCSFAKLANTRLLVESLANTNLVFYLGNDQRGGGFNRNPKFVR